MSRGILVPTVLSPAEAEEVLALPCLLILAGIAQPVFPTGDRSTPSPAVLIRKVRGGPPGLSTCLPVVVDWRQWRTSVVPVLEDETWRTGNPVTSALLGSGGGKERLTLLIGKALRASFKSAGWGP